MAKTQRWRRGRAAGEDTTSAADAPAETPETGVDEAATEEVGDAATPALESDLEAADLEADLEADPEADLEDDSEIDDADDADDADEDEDAVGEAAAEELDRDAEEDLADDDLADDAAQDDDYLGATGSTFTAGVGDSIVVVLLQAAHAKQAITTAVAMALAAAVAGRPAREAAIVLLTVLVGQSILGWHNDIVDRDRDRRHDIKGKPVATGRLLTENAWYAIVAAALILVPLSITTGIKAATFYLAAVAIGMLGNVVLRTGFLSWWSWALSFALLPAYLSYGGWGGQAVGSAPETAIVILAALLGIGVHFMRAVWGLVADHEEGWTYLPLKLGLKLGATRLLALSTLYMAIIVLLLVVMGAKVGLSR